MLSLRPLAIPPLLCNIYLGYLHSAGVYQTVHQRTCKTQLGLSHCLTCVSLVCLQQIPPEAVDGSSPWEIADGLLYPEDILDDSPYLFVEIPGRLTGSYSGYNVDPLFVTVSKFTSTLQPGKYT